MASKVYLALGANIGNRAANMAMALRLLRPSVEVDLVSPLYESAPEDGSDQPPYYNAACRALTELAPQALLEAVQAVERAVGRRPTGVKWAPRPVDVDILLYDGQVVESKSLTIPHPRLAERAFVVKPLLDIEPGLALPDGRRMAELPAASGSGLELVAGGQWWQEARGIGLPALARPA